jgi:hypothetical protein
MKFRLINKFTDFSGNDILQIGDVIEPINDEYKIEWKGGSMILDYNGIKKANQDGKLLFEEIKENKTELELIIQEVPEDDDNLIGNWRIQLDVKTTRKKLKEIEKVFRETISDII